MRSTVDPGTPHLLLEKPRDGESAGLHESGGPFLSVIVTVTERPVSLLDLYDEYAAPLRARGWSFEFLFALEPWGDYLVEPLESARRAGEPIRVLHAHRTMGEAGLLKEAGRRCRGEIVITLPAYYRVRAACLPQLVERVRQGADLAVAWRSPRRDSWVNRLQNRVFHFLLGLSASRRFHDIACGVRVMPARVLGQIPLYGDFSRFLPLLAVQEGFVVEEVACPQHPGDRQPRVYAPGVYLRRLIDLFGVFFLLRFTYKPLRFFGLLGGGLSIVGGVILLALFFLRLGGQAIADRPLLLLGVLLFSLGVQIVALGLVGELIVHLSVPSELSYRVRERVEKSG